MSEGVNRMNQQEIVGKHWKGKKKKKNDALRLRTALGTKTRIWAIFQRNYSLNERV